MTAEEIKQINFMWKLIQEMQKQEGLRRLEFMEHLKNKQIWKKIMIT